MKILKQLTKLKLLDYILWITSVIIIILSYILANDQDYLSLIASLIGVTAVIYVANGYVIGEMLSIIFAIFYGIVSYKFRYYGELITYVFMSLPMAIIAVVSWLKNPYKETDEVKVGKVSLKQVIIMNICTIIITIIFYFILKYFNTPYLIFSTISVATSFIAVYLTALRSEYYAVGYALNDIVLIVLWILASIENISYLPIIFCFVMFFILDTYGFINWTLMKKRQID